jgi:hypothetical protein
MAALSASGVVADPLLRRRERRCPPAPAEPTVAVPHQGLALFLARRTSRAARSPPSHLRRRSSRPAAEPAGPRLPWFRQQRLERGEVVVRGCRPAARSRVEGTDPRIGDVREIAGGSRDDAEPVQPPLCRRRPTLAALSGEVRTVAPPRPASQPSHPTVTDPSTAERCQFERGHEVVDWQNCQAGRIRVRREPRARSVG